MGPMMFAGENCSVCTDGNISVNCFHEGEDVRIPLLESNKEGSGGLDVLLDEIRKHYDKPLVFVNVINPALRKHLVKNGYDLAYESF